MTRKNTVVYKIDEEIDGVELMDAAYFDHQYTTHAHHEFAIGVMEKGIQDYTSERSPTDYFYQGEIMTMNPGRMHAGKSVDENGYKYKMFYINPQVLENIDLDIRLDKVGSPHFDHVTISDKSLGRTLLHLHDCLGNHQLDTIQRQHLFYETFASLLKQHAASAPKELRLSTDTYAIRRTIDYIQAYFDEKIQLKDLATVSGMSTYYLNRIFAKSIGMPPHQYLISLRLTKARDLLKKRTLISQTAYETGFADQSHLTRSFKLFWGVTPRQYQKSVC